jgi:hypothetical protein
MAAVLSPRVLVLAMGHPFLNVVLPARPQVQSHEHTLGIRQVPDDLAHRNRQLSDQRRQGEDLITSGQLRILQKVYDLDTVFSFKVANGS